MTTPTFSVVVPAFNAERTIEATLRSVLAQTRTDFEAVVVDDGSTDATARRVHALSGDGRVRLVSQANAGPAAARNTGISATTGPFVSFLDADDLWLPTYLAQMGRALTSSPEAAVAFTDAWVWDENVGRFGRRKIMAMVDPPEVVPRDSIELFRELVARNFFYVSTTVRRSVLEHVGGFDETVRGSEDWELWLRIASSGYPAVRAAPVLAVYRVQAGSISSDRSAMHEAMIQTLRKAATYSSEAVVHERLAGLESSVPGPVAGGRAGLGRRERLTRRLPSWARLRSYRLTPPPDVSPDLLDLLRAAQLSS